MRRSVLIIEDHPQTGQQLVAMLDRRGIFAKCVTTMAEGIELIHEYDCVVSDLALPDSAAPQTLHRLKEFAEEFIPVRGFSGVDDPEVVLLAKKLGVPLILKGTSAEGIMESILHALSEKSPSHELAQAIIDNRETVRELPLYRTANFFDRWPLVWRRIAQVITVAGILVTAVTAGAAIYKGFTNHVVEKEASRVAGEKVNVELSGIVVRVKSLEVSEQENHDSNIKILAKLDELGGKIDENKKDFTHQLDRIEGQHR